MSFAQTDTLIPKTFYYGDSTISSQGYFLNDQPEGYWMTYYPDGTLKSEGNRQNSFLDGEWLFYDHNSDTLEIINYRNSIKNGWHFIYTNNVLSSKTLFLDAKIIGLSYFYGTDTYIEIPHKNSLKHGLAFEYEMDNIIRIIEYKNGFKVSKKDINRWVLDSLKNGTWISFFPNRKIHIESNYQKDTLHGFYREYDVQGNLLKNLYYVNGLLETSSQDLNISKIKQNFYANGNLKSSGYYTFDVSVGLHKEFSQDGEITTGLLYDENGFLIGKGSLDSEGKKTGKWIFFGEKKNVISEGYYKKNKRVKDWKFYHSNSKLEQGGSYKKGKLHGEWNQYSEKGNLFKTENYKKGILNGAYIQYKTDGTEFVKGEYDNNIQDGEWIYYYDFLTIHKKYIKGEKSGHWFSEYVSGQLAFEGDYLNGEPNGKHIYYYDSGIVKEYQYYRYGSKEKIWSRYDAFEDQSFSYLYKNDKLVKINGYRYKHDEE